MNTNQNQNQVKGNLVTVIGALNDLVNNWDNDTQELFENFGTWDIPSLDDTLAQFSEFLEFLRSQA
jgi:hypothetical protein